MPVLVALSRMYRGEHHPTDIAGSLLFSALWLTATSLLIRPNTDGRGRRREAAADANRVGGDQAGEDQASANQVSANRGARSSG
jgi:undecaprenyl-diphosphatase